MTVITNMREFVRNAATRRLSSMFPGYFPDHKHNHYADYGWPAHLEFPQLYSMFDRNGLAGAAVNKTVRKTWESAPTIREAEEGADETQIEEDIRKHFTKLRVWQCLAESHRRSLVGDYGAAILRLADGKRFQEPVDRVGGGVEGLVEVIPVWEAQLGVSQWDSDERSETYGKPLMYVFNEAEVGGKRNTARSFEVHPDRIIIWSEDGTINGRSLLRAGFNDLLDLEKIKGAGGEGFWKNAKSAPVLEVSPEAKLAEMAKAMDVDEGDLVEAMNSQVESWQKGFDKLLMMQGIEAKTLGVNLPSPEHFFSAPLQSFAASVEMPVKILVGMQTGERASKEDAEEWARTCMARRSDSVVPSIMELVNRLERFGILPEKDWWLDWDNLTEAGMPERMERAGKMSEINERQVRADGEPVFTGDEIRDAVSMAPLGEEEATRNQPSDEELGVE